MSRFLVIRLLELYSCLQVGAVVTSHSCLLVGAVLALASGKAERRQVHPLCLYASNEYGER